MKIRESLRNRNRTVLEMELGILFCGVVGQIVCLFLIGDQREYAFSLWLGILMAVAATHHMYHTLLEALDFDEKQAAKLIFRGYIIRYSVLIAIIMAIIYTKKLNPLIVFVAYMSLKVTVYLQPLTHKLCNIFFHETDPVAEPFLEEEKE